MSTSHATSQQDGGYVPRAVLPFGGGNGGSNTGSSNTGALQDSTAHQASSPGSSGNGGAVGGGSNTGAQQSKDAVAAAMGLLEGQVGSLREQLSSVATSAGIASLAHAADLASATSAHAAQVWQGMVWLSKRMLI